MNAAQPIATVQSVGTVATDKASRYLQQLAKHFDHKLPVTFDAEQGEIIFSIGTCAMRAEAGRLILTLTSADAEQLAQLRDVVERHLVRFAFREADLAVDWQQS